MLKIIFILSVLLLVNAVHSSFAHADIMIFDQTTAKNSGFFIKVVKKSNQVTYQLFQDGEYFKDLGGSTTFDVEKVVNYSESLPARLKTDHQHKMLVIAGAVVIGAGVGYLIMARSHANAEASAAADVVKENIGPLKQFFNNYKPYIIATGVGAKAGVMGSFLSKFFFVTADQDQLRAALTSEALMNEDRVVFMTKSPSDAVRELDTALREIQ